MCTNTESQSCRNFQIYRKKLNTYLIRDTPYSLCNEYTETFSGNECLPCLRQITEIFSQCLESSSIQRWKNPRIGSSRSTDWVQMRSLAPLDIPFKGVTVTIERSAI